ncbi:MAG: tRNA (N6-isopentenyl adenosine(37)-C2)-methylthiotransferase MiaB, partial [Candidatus Aminicenantes bacterium]|nr:tRNA (N6-isopentenyl adenosine(37)-C2)-methylthiotransferase MiaB [Candidatus Aminicenantes bacterium]
MNFFIKTFGCQMNVNDSEKIRQLLENKGLTLCGSEAAAAIIIVNSCAVRAKAQEKIFSYIGQFPAAKKIIVTGCVAQVEKEALFKKKVKIDYVVGTHQFYRIGEILDEIAAGRRAKAAAAFSRQWQELVPAAQARSSRVTGYVSIMEGCDNFCSYCIVPFTRGREKYRPLAAILREAEYLAGRGFKEIVLLGQNVNHWHEAKGGRTFPELLRQLARNVPVPWIRFITSYPGYHDRELIRVMAANRNIARHIHFPAQSGSTRILKKMNRTYSRAQYLEIVRAFRAAMPEMKFSSDFIVGFPGENDRDFNLTLSLIEQVEYESIFSFIYSPRPGTKAANYSRELAPGAVKQRLYALQELQARIQLKNNRRWLGQISEVLITEKHPKKIGEMIGRSESYRVVNFASRTPVGAFTRVKITAAGPHSLRGEE